MEHPQVKPCLAHTTQVSNKDGIQCCVSRTGAVSSSLRFDPLGSAAQVREC